jgi:hypothetical protein
MASRGDPLGGLDYRAVTDELLLPENSVQLSPGEDVIGGRGPAPA